MLCCVNKINTHVLNGTAMCVNFCSNEEIETQRRQQKNIQKVEQDMKDFIICGSESTVSFENVVVQRVLYIRLYTTKP